jgi:hypothetical protein
MEKGRRPRPRPISVRPITAHRSVWRVKHSRDWRIERMQLLQYEIDSARHYFLMILIPPCLSRMTYLMSVEGSDALLARSRHYVHLLHTDVPHRFGLPFPVLQEHEGRSVQDGRETLVATGQGGESTVNQGHRDNGAYRIRLRAVVAYSPASFSPALRGGVRAACNTRSAFRWFTHRRSRPLRTVFLSRA